MSPEDARQFSEEQALEGWLALAGPIDRLAEAGATDSGNFRALPGSALAEEYSRTAPCQLSHAVGHCVIAVIDHLHPAERRTV